MMGSSRKLLESPNQSPDFRSFIAIDSNSTSRPSLNHDIFRSWNGNQVYLRDDDHEDGDRSPPLFRSGYRNLSPPSRSRAIASGQKELMEMVSNMPESCYELSLRDLVEPPLVLGETLADEPDLDRPAPIRKSAFISGGGGGAGRMAENGGLYLRMGFTKPVATRTRTMTKKKSDCGLNVSSRVSPKPPPQAVEKDWWKKSVVNNGSVQSSTSSGSSSGSHGSAKNRAKSSNRYNRSGGCWSCLYPKYNEQDE